MRSNRRTPTTSVDERIRAKEQKFGIVRNQEGAGEGKADGGENGAVESQNDDDAEDDHLEEAVTVGEENEDDDSNRQRNLMLVAEVQYEEVTPEPSATAGISGVVIEEAVAVKAIRPRRESLEQTAEEKGSRRRIAVAGVLVVLIVVAVAVVVTVVLVLQNRSNSQSPGPPAAASCSLCAKDEPSIYSPEELAGRTIETGSDGSGRNVTCLDLDQIALGREETDDSCFQLQVLASFQCGCRAPHPSAQCWLCPSGHRLLPSRLVEPWLSNRTCLDVGIQAASLSKDGVDNNTTAVEEECEKFSGLSDFCCHPVDDDSS